MIRYDENGLVPVVIQDTQGRVLMTAYMNEEAFNKTLQTGETWFFSRRRQEVWKKERRRAMCRRYAEFRRTAIGMRS